MCDHRVERGTKEASSYRVVSGSYRVVWNWYRVLLGFLGLQPGFGLLFSIERV